MNRTLINLLNDLIQRQNLNLPGPARNLLGVPLVGIANPQTVQAASHWKTYTLIGVVTQSVPLSPDDIVNQLSTIQVVSAPIGDAINGLITTRVQGGTTLHATVVSLANAIGFKIEAVSPGRQIAIYSNE